MFGSHSFVLKVYLCSKCVRHRVLVTIDDLEDVDRLTITSYRQICTIWRSPEIATSFNLQVGKIVFTILCASRTDGHVSLLPVYGTFVLETFQTIVVTIQAWNLLCAGWGQEQALLSLGWEYSLVPMVSGIGRTHFLFRSVLFGLLVCHAETDVVDLSSLVLGAELLRSEDIRTE